MLTVVTDNGSNIVKSGESENNEARRTGDELDQLWIESKSEDSDSEDEESGSLGEYVFYLS